MQYKVVGGFILDKEKQLWSGTHRMGGNKLRCCKELKSIIFP